VGVLVGAVIGLLSGWGLFEITEARKRRVQAENIRRMIVVELRGAEVVLNTLVCKLSAALNDDTRFVAEMRWSAHRIARQAPTVGVSVPEEMSEEMAKKFAALSDAQVLLMKGSVATSQRCIAVPTPVTRSVLTSPGVQLDSRELEMLAAIEWQAGLLAAVAEQVNSLYPLTFTVSDPTNHGIVVDNIDTTRKTYYYRATVMLDVIRRASEALDRV
jgi:hypothetical protein